MKSIDVVGIGNPLMDVIVKVEENKLAELDLIKGTMKLVDDREVERVEEHLKDHESKLVPGGSVANTLSAFTLLGGTAVFIGKAGLDEHGKIYEEILEGGNVRTKIAKDTGRTGKVISLVTPDSERTFATYLGMCLQLKKEDIAEQDIKDAKILHVTGYQLEDKGLREAALHAIGIAKDNDTKVSIDLADPELVKRNTADLKELIKHADILFSNEEEIKALTGKAPEDAIKDFDWISTLIIKLGKEGSIARHEGNILRTGAVKVEAVDTTGAGDSYAAAILYGLSQNKDMQTAMLAASQIAGKVVATIGARLESAEDIKALLSGSQ